MLFLGDIALPDAYKVDVGEEIRALDGGVVANLEGLIREDNIPAGKFAVYNETNVLAVLKALRVKAVSLANNHVKDVPEAFPGTKRLLDESGIQYFGAGMTPEEARRPAIVDDGGIQYALLGFGWEVIGCKPVGDGVFGVNPLTFENVRFCVEEAKKRYPDARIVTFFHWDYELEIYPQPLHRQLAREAVAWGAYAVVGAHPHCVQGTERYRGAVIAYSLGNFLFPNGYYFGGRLSFPPLADLEMGVRLTGDNAETVYFRHNQSARTIALATPPQNGNLWQSLSDADYTRWFKKNRRKKKLLPVYRSKNPLMIRANDLWVMTRDRLIRGLLKLGLKGGSR